MPVPQPIQYQGSKRGLAPRILARLPARFKRLLEPFAGSAALSAACAAKGQASSFRLNDANKPLARLLKEAIEDPERLAEAYAALWAEDNYGRVRDEFNRSQEPELLLYLLARCVMSSVRYNSKGEFNQSADKRRLGVRPSVMERRLKAFSGLLKGRSEVSGLDYREALAEAEPGDVVYLDPPYQGVCGVPDTRYRTGIDFKSFVDALRDLNKRKIPFALSYDGRTGEHRFGRPLPASLRLELVELEAGLSGQGMLHGRRERTVESLYISPALSKLKMRS